MEHALIIVVVGLIAGIGGAVLGLGGGIIVTPILTLLMGIPIKYAIGASIIAVIATSSGATIAYLKDNVLNLRVAMFLEIFTTIGAIVGAYLNGLFKPTILYMFFGILLIYSSYNMVRKLMNGNKEVLKKVVPDKLAQKLNLNSSYYDKSTQKTIKYQVEKVPSGSAIMFGAGIASGLLGIGSGAFKVMAMDTFMKMPLKPSTSTSNLMMGVTAAASATIYLFNGSIRPLIAVPLSLGILIGAGIGSRIMQILPSKWLRIIFVPIIFYIGLQMFLKGWGINIW